MTESHGQDLSTGGVAPRLILASASAARAQMLRSAGVAVDILPVAVDEAELKASFKASGAGVRDAADALAELKALRGSAGQPGALVIGADQMLDCDDVWFDKPADRDQARAQLQALRGRTHRLTTAACVARDGAVVWRHVETARLTMREFSDGFLERYLARMGDGIRATVGGYQLEGLGAQLLTRVEGSHFVVLGLPLLALLDFLRTQGVLIP